MPRCTSTGQRSFLIRGIEMWKCIIDNNIIRPLNVGIFKNIFKIFLLKKCLDLKYAILLIVIRLLHDIRYNIKLN